MDSLLNGKQTRLGVEAGPVGSGILLVGWLRESLAIALFDAAHGSEQMVVRAGPKCLRLAVQKLHHERIEDADLLQCRHVAMDATERGVVKQHPCANLMSHYHSVPKLDIRLIFAYIEVGFCRERRRQESS